MKNISRILLLMFAVTILAGCEESQSYSELLKAEEHAVNWYLAQQTVCLDVPEDGNFLTGEDAPFYKMDEDGFVYMQIVNKGNMDNRPEKGQRVYFRYLRYNIKTMCESGKPADEALKATTPDGNAVDIDGSTSNTYLVYGNRVLTSTTNFGDGIQVPLQYVGYDSEVNLVIKSPEGFSVDQTTCNPYIYKIKFFEGIY